MEDRYFYFFAGCLIAMAITSIMQTNLIGLVGDKVIALSADVEFLKDHTIARETEARP